MLRGIDVSHWNEITDYKAVKNAGVQFAIVKVNNTSATADKKLYTHIDGFKSAGIACNMGYSYCYANTKDKAILASNGFVALAKQVGIDYMWLDLEDAVVQNLGSTLIDIINVYKSVAETNGLKFGIYTYSYFYNAFLKPYLSELQHIPFWIARYPNQLEQSITGSMPTTASLPKDVIVSGWQYSSKGVVNGIKGYVDLNVWYSDDTVSDGTYIEISTDHNPFTEPTTDCTVGTLGNNANWVLWYLWRFGKLTDKYGNPDSTLINGTYTKQTAEIVKDVQSLLGLTVDGIVGNQTRSIWKKLA
jgi:GH25 family lysozyme M1 (1,4-beta-N-acetylmuramidase)